MNRKNKHLEAELVERYGPVMGGKELRQALGFRSYPAFAQAMHKGTIGVAVFDIPGRRGKFAMTSEVSAWLENHKAKRPAIGKRPG